MKIALNLNTLTVDFDTCNNADATTHQLISDAFNRLKNGCNVAIKCPEQAFKDYCAQNFKHVQAAGGAVCDVDGHWLIMRRRDMWDLPKGKREEGETLEENALREVQEETGLGNLRIERLLCTTYHIHNLYGEWTLKEVFWYLMKTNQHSPAPTPQTEEEISTVEWVSKKECCERLKQSFVSLKEVAATLESID